MVLPAGTEVPPLLHAAVSLLAAGVVAALLVRADPRVDGAHVAALAPWMATGAALYVVYERGLLPGVVAPFASSPTVYLTTATVAGAVWYTAADATVSAPRVLLVTGSMALLLPAMYVLGHAAIDGSLRPGPSLVALAGALALTAATWSALRRRWPGATAATGTVGALAVFGHVLDGLSTAVGVTVLSVAERTPLSRAVIEAGEALPSLPYLGTAWLFVVVKLCLASALVVLFADFVRDEPAAGNLFLGLAAAVGLGPGVHNVLLFALGVGG